MRWTFAATSMLACLMPLAVTAQVVCLPISKVQISDAPLLGPAAIGAITAPFESRCLGLQDFDAILEAVTAAYIERGYVLSRAYLPEQDLTDGLLKVAVVEGELATININGTQESRWTQAVFPGLIGKPVNLRQVEQGLDQIQTMPRWTAEMEFMPGADVGTSVLEVTAATPKPFEVRLTANNRGDDQSGKWNTALEGDFSNVLKLNEVWRFSYGESLGSAPLSLATGDDTNRQANLSISVPSGPWSFDVGLAWSDYKLTIPGAITPINTDGYTRSQSFAARYLLDRDQKTKEYLAARLTRSDSENFILDTRIDASSRVLTALELSYALSRPLADGELNLRVSMEKGLTLAGAVLRAGLPAGSPDPQFLRSGLQLDYARAVGGDTIALIWSSTLSAQASRDLLFGGQSFAVGGVSTVRGSRIALVRGSSGVVWRNELEYALPRAESPILPAIKLYSALDLGRVFSQSSIGVIGGSAAGGTVGLRADNGRFALDVSYQEILAVSDGLQRPNGEFFAAIEITF